MRAGLPPSEELVAQGVSRASQIAASHGVAYPLAPLMPRFFEITLLPEQGDRAVRHHRTAARDAATVSCQVPPSTTPASAAASQARDGGVVVPDGNWRENTLFSMQPRPTPLPSWPHALLMQHGTVLELGIS